jgi:Ca2+-binding EF-hand superfamily protein
MKLLTFLAAVLALVVSVNAADEKKPAAGADKPKPDPAAVFGKKDTNADGKLSKEEFVAKAKDAAKAEQQFAARDKDKDGFVSKEEFTAVGKKKK